MKATHPENRMTSVLPVQTSGKVDPIESLTRKLLLEIGENPLRSGILDTPQRFSQAIRYLTSGYRGTLKEVVGGAIYPAPKHASEKIEQRNIAFYSLCEHHLLPFFGKVHVEYQPHQKIIGLSKISRVVDFYARRLQIQERLTGEIADGLFQVLEPRRILVTIEAEHLCVAMRGVHRTNSPTITTCALPKTLDKKTQIV